MRPPAKIRNVVVFAHGWSTPLPSGGFAAWIAHLRARGSVVVYPRYQAGTGDTTTSALAAFRTGVVAALRRLAGLHVPILALGKSFGGSAVFDYAAEARAWGVPAPNAVVSIFPAYPIASLPTTPLARDIYVEILVGDADTTAGSGGARAFWSWLAGHPAAEKRFEVVHSRPGFAATHDSAQQSDPIARAVFWKPIDSLLTRLGRPR
jgi:hypothetical protein